MRILLMFSFSAVVFFLSLFSCQTQPDTADQDQVSTEDFTQEARQAFDAFWTLFNGGNLADSTVFVQAMSFFDEDLQMPSDKGNPPADGSGLFGWLKGYVQTNTPFFDVTVDHLEATKDMAYVLYRYHETFTEMATGELSVDVMHSAIMVLLKNADGMWKCVVMKFT